MKKKESEKPRYSMWRCCAWMTGLAWHKKEKKVLVLCLLQAALAVASNLVNLYLAPSILSAVERRVSFGQLLAVIISFVGMMLVCSAASAYVDTNTLYGRCTLRIAILGDINQKCNTTSYSNLMEPKFLKLRGIARKCTQNGQEATEAVWETLSGFLRDLAGFVIYVCLLATLNVWFMKVIVITALTGYFGNRRLSAYEYRHREERGDLENRIWYEVQGGKKLKSAKEIRIFGLKPWFDEITEKAMDAYTAYRRRMGNVAMWGKILDLTLTFLRNGLAYWILVRLVLAGQLSAAEFLLYFSAAGNFSGWVNGILKRMSRLYSQCLELSSVREFLEYPEPFRFEDGAHLEPSSDVGHALQLDHVSYRYPGAQEDTLSDICLTIRSGEKIAVVGKNGAGKTTLVKLLCGLFDPTKGRVLLDGVDIRTYNRRDYYAMITAVFQDFSLLPATIATNVAQTEEGQERSRVEECVKKAGLDEKIDSLKDGYETYLNRQVYEDGTELSGGRTCIYISHRLASCRFCDVIVVFDHGQIVQQGTHEKLLEDPRGKYHALWYAQAQYYNE